MKTTVEISPPILEEAKAVARRERTTVRALIEEGLRKVLADRRQPKKFKLKPVTFAGRGLAPGLSEGSWEEIRDRAYQGRGA